MDSLINSVFVIDACLLQGQRSGGAGDKGPGRGLAGDLRGRKRSMKGHRVPGSCGGGSIEPGSESDLPIIGSDFFPTALAAAGIQPPQKTYDGVNLVQNQGSQSHERSLLLEMRWFVAHREDLEDSR